MATSQYVVTVTTNRPIDKEQFARALREMILDIELVNTRRQPIEISNVTVRRNN